MKRRCDSRPPSTRAIVLLVGIVAGTGICPANAQPSAPGDLLCHEGATVLSFTVLGVPSASVPVALEKQRDRVWALFAHRVLRIDRRGGAVDVKAGAAEAGETWSAMTVDPVDGSLWVAARDRAVLRRFRASDEVRPQEVPVAVAGGGSASGALAIEASADAIYLVPAAEAETVWRVGRDGRVLDATFPRPAPGTLETAPVAIELVRDADGAVLAWLPRTRRVFRALPAGGWAETDASRFRFEGAAPGARLFFWKGIPVFTGASAAGSELHFPEGRTLFEPCRGWRIIDVATDASGYAVLTDKAVLWGNFAASQPEASR